MRPNICILRTDGTNCDPETANAFLKAGGNPELVHINQLRSGTRRLRSYQILAIPGGFSYGDDVASGKILAIELISFLHDELQEFVDAGKLVIGICNGFQVLVQSGLLPLNTIRIRYATLEINDSGKFECRWIKLITEKGSPCIFTRGYDNEIMLPVAHGEGSFFVDTKWPEIGENKNCVALRYSEGGQPADFYPANPNGSLYSIAGVCDPFGRIFGLMPHPERFVEFSQFDNWRRESIAKPHGLQMFENAVNFAVDL